MLRLPPVPAAELLWAPVADPAPEAAPAVELGSPGLAGAVVAEGSGPVGEEVNGPGPMLGSSAAPERGFDPGSEEPAPSPPEESACERGSEGPALVDAAGAAGASLAIDGGIRAGLADDTAAAACAVRVAVWVRAAGTTRWLRCGAGAASECWISTAPPTVTAAAASNVTT